MLSIVLETVTGSCSDKTVNRDWESHGTGEVLERSEPFLKLLQTVVVKEGYA